MKKIVVASLSVGILTLTGTLAAAEVMTTETNSPTNNPFNATPLGRDSRLRILDEERIRTKLLQEKRDQKRAEFETAEIESRLKSTNLHDSNTLMPKAREEKPKKMVANAKPKAKEKPLPINTSNTVSPLPKEINQQTQPVLEGIIDFANEERVGIWNDGKGGYIHKPIGNSVQMASSSEATFTTLQKQEEEKIRKAKQLEEQKKKMQMENTQSNQNQIPYLLPLKPTLPQAQ